MLSKLLDELYWLKMEEEISLYFKGRKDRGLYCVAGDEKSRIHSFIESLISEKIAKRESDVFGKDLFSSKTMPYPRESFIAIDEIGSHIDLKDVKSQILSSIDKFNRAVYSDSSGFVKNRMTLQRKVNDKSYDGPYWDAVNKIESTIDIDEALASVEELVTHKITIYKKKKS